MAQIYSLDEEPRQVVELDVVEPEDPSFPAQVTQYPVEDGRIISDHVVLDPITLDIQGVVTGEEASGKIAALRRWWRDRHQVRYIGRNIMRGVMTALDTSHSYAIYDGFSFSITIEEVRVARLEVVDVTGDDPGGED